MSINPHKPKVTGIVVPTASQRAFWIYSGGDPESDPAVLVVRFTLSPVHDRECLKRAWRMTIAQHDMLRASINPDKHGDPLLVIRDVVPDNIHFPESAASPKISISLSKAPAQQLFCVYTDDNSCNLTWHCHHALLDGWSAQLVVNDFVENYQCLQASGVLRKPTPRNYLEIHRKISQLDESGGVSFWRNLLHDFKTPSVFTLPSVDMRQTSFDTCQTSFLQSAQVSKFQLLCKGIGVTPATAVQFLWACAVGQLCDRDDVVIGVAVSGRPAAVAGIEKAVGCFATVAPSRVKLDLNKSIEAHLKNLQVQLFAASEYQYMGLLSILEQADKSCGNRLFDSLLVIENLPHGDNSNHIGGPQVHNYQSDVVSSYPLTLTVIPGDEWIMRCDYHGKLLSSDWVRAVSEYLVALAGRMLHNWSQPLAAMLQACSPLLPAHPNTRALSLQNTSGLSKAELFATLEGPVNQTELDMVALWEDLLHVRPISVSSRFFDIGGNSLLAVKLIDRVANSFNRKIPAAVFLQNPTVRDCAQCLLLCGEEAARMPSLVALKASGSQSGHKMTLYCLHAGGGHAMFYREFATHLPDHIACYALQPRGIDGFEPPIASISEMATHYIDEIKRHQPVGPYHLLCYCFGGALILEMAKQLQQQGEQVGHLFVADAPAPIPEKHLMARFGWKAYLTYELLMQKRGDVVWKNMVLELKRRVKRRVSLEDSPDSDPKALARVQQACEYGFKTYRATSTDLPFLFLNAGKDDPSASRAVYMRHWKWLAPNSTHYPLSADHCFMFDPAGVVETAGVVSAIIEQSVSDFSRSQCIPATDSICETP